MSRDSQRLALLDELSHLVRSNQRTTDVVDDLVAQLLGVNRTDGRCLDLLEQNGRMSAGQLAAGSGLTSGAMNTARASLTLGTTGTAEVDGEKKARATRAFFASIKRPGD